MGTHTAALSPSVRLKRKPSSWGMHFITTTKMPGAIFFPLKLAAFKREGEVRKNRGCSTNTPSIFYEVLGRRGTFL